LGSNWVRFHFLKKSKLVKSARFNGGFAFFELGSFRRFCVFKKGRLATGTEGCNACQLGTATRRPSHLVHGGVADPPSPRLRRDMEATMAMIVLSSPATLTGGEEKKTGPSRFGPDFRALPFFLPFWVFPVNLWT